MHEPPSSRPTFYQGQQGQLDNGSDNDCLTLQRW